MLRAYIDQRKIAPQNWDVVRPTRGKDLANSVEYLTVIRCNFEWSYLYNGGNKISVWTNERKTNENLVPKLKFRNINVRNYAIR